MNVTAIDLFCGSGGMSVGFSDAGIDVLIASDNDKHAVSTYKANFPGTRVVKGDITDKSVKERILDAIGAREIDVVFCGFPCQGFSLAGNRNPLDKRGKLYKDLIEMLSKIRPKIVVMENVKGLLSMKVLRQEKDDTTTIVNSLYRLKDLKRYASQRILTDDEKAEIEFLSSREDETKRAIEGMLVPLLPKILLELSDIGYDARYEVLDAANFGSAQRRERVFIVASSNLDGYSFPVPGVRPSTVQSMLSSLEDAPEHSLPNHVFTKHHPSMIERLSKVKRGTTLYSNYSGAWYRLLPDAPARCVTGNHGGVFIHYKHDRVLTCRELARLQNYPDTFVFHGPKSAQLVQIGNSVPCILARVMATSIVEFLTEGEKRFKKPGA